MFALLLGVRLVYLFRYRVNSDEPQHLHVVWAWAQGMIPYRDFFDNHTPLFHILCIPFLCLIGERPDAIVLMRLVVFPLYLLTLVFTYRIACLVSTRRAALWATFFTALSPFMFLEMLEFRTDDLWTFLWLATVLVLLSKPLTVARMFIVGILLGAALSVSMKTVLFLMVLGATALAILVMMRRDREGPPPRVLAGWACAALSGFLVFPVALLLFFAYQRALPQLLYCTIEHNALPGAGPGYLHMFLFLPAAWFWIWAIRRAHRRHGSAAAAAREIVVISACILYLAILLTLWPVVETQDCPPCTPFIFILIARLILPEREKALDVARPKAWRPLVSRHINYDT